MFRGLFIWLAIQSFEILLLPLFPIGVFENVFYLTFERAEIVLYNIPKYSCVNLIISVNYVMSHVGNVLPWNFWISASLGWFRTAFLFLISKRRFDCFWSASMVFSKRRTPFR